MKCSVRSSYKRHLSILKVEQTKRECIFNGIFYFMWMSMLCNSRDLPFAWRTVKGAPWSCVAEHAVRSFLSSCIFLLKNLCDSRTTNSGLFSYNHCCCCVGVNVVMLTVVSVGFVFLYLARHVMDQYCSS